MSKTDNSLYVRNDSESLIIIILYVDDLVIGGEHLVDINKVKSLREIRDDGHEGAPLLPRYRSNHTPTRS